MGECAGIVKYLSAHHGSACLEELEASGVFGEPEAVQHLTRDRSRFAVGLYRDERRLVAKTGLRLCPQIDCPQAGCTCLHLCKLYLYGECHRARCSLPHDLNSEHNSELLRAHDLAELDKSELCVLLMLNDRFLLPDVCFEYNGKGCQDWESCIRIHICQNFLRGDCSCSRAHDFYERQPFRNLQAKGVPDTVMVSMKSLYINKTILKDLEKADKRADRQQRARQDHAVRGGAGGSRGGARGGARGGGARGGHARGGGGARGGHARGGGGARGGARGGGGADASSGEDAAIGGDAASGSDDASDTETASRGPQPTRRRRARGNRGKTDICLFFLKGHCIHDTEQCYNVHCKLPYRWEVREDQQWTMLENSEGVEKDYCDPKKTHSTADGEALCFDTMTLGLRKVRRLSSVSSVLQHTFLLTTEWLWYWEDEFATWNQYKSPGINQNTSISSTELEEKFQSDAKEEVQFTAVQQTYTLNFQDFLQTNNEYGTKRLVRRRPRFVSSSEVQKIRTSKRPLNNQLIPKHWDKTQVPETGYKRVVLQASSSEYQEVEQLFRDTMTAFSVDKIERIQNKSLWDHFQLRRDQMCKMNGGRSVSERQLFQYMCGTHGTAYGKGSYFARDAKYSHSYTGACDPRAMFVSRVLVGHYTRGSSSYVRPPSKDGGDTLLYDSCVDNVDSPTIFVVFDRLQVYPEYLLTYSEQLHYGYDDVLSAAPAPVVQPAPVRRRTSLFLPTSVYHRVPLSQPMPVVQPAPVSRRTSLFLPTSVYHRVPLSQPMPVVQPAPVSRHKSLFLPTSVYHRVPLSQPMPVVQPPPVFQPQPQF